MNRKQARNRNWNKRSIMCYTSGLQEMVKNRGNSLTIGEREAILAMAHVGQTIISNWKKRVEDK